MKGDFLMKKRVLKGISILMCLIMAVSLFAGCGKTEQNTQSDASATPSQSSSAGPVKEQVTMETIQVWTNNAATKIEDEKMVADFNNGPGKEKGINIEYKIYGGDYMNVLNVAVAAGQAPHLFKLQQGNLTQYANAGWSVAIEDIPGGEDFLKKYDGLLQPGYNIINGKTYTVPVAVSTLGVAYNKELLAKNGFNNPPKTWAELREMAKTITENGGGKEFGFIEGLKSTGYVSVNGLWHYIASIGHAEFNHQTGRYDFSAFLPMLQLWVDMRNDGSWFPGCEGLNNDQARAQFAEGNIGFKLSASWDPAVWQDQFPAKMDWGICRPVEDPADRYRDYAYQSISIVLGAKAKSAPEKAFEVFKLWTSDETVINLFEAGKAIPYTSELIAKASVQPTVKNFSDFAKLDNTYNYMMNPKGELKLEGDTAEVVLAQVILGLTSPEEAVADLNKRYNEALDRAIADGLDISQFIDKNSTR